MRGIRSSIVAALLFLVSGGVFAQGQKPDHKLHIYLCFGQSNMEAGARPEPQDLGEVERPGLLPAAAPQPATN